MARAITFVSRRAGASPRRLAAVTSLWLLAGQFGAAQLLPHTRLEVNMGPMALGSATETLYNDQHSAMQYPALHRNCSDGTKYRSCVQQILAQYHQQGITGVRFQFDMHEALNGTQVNTYWTQGLGSFFADLGANSIYNVTPAIGWIAADWGQYYMKTNPPHRSAPSKCGSYPTRALMRFSPTAPFGEWCKENCDARYPWQGQWDVDEQWNNDAYDCAPENTYNFVGWPAIYGADGAVAALLQTASNNDLTVTELDAQNEMNLEQYTVYARLIVDNTHSDEMVLANLRQAMSDHGFDADKVAYSAPGVRTWVPLYDCLSVYGDSARIVAVSEIHSAIAGMLFGWASPSVTYVLGCGGSTQNMVYLPMGHSSSTIIDVHDSPCVTTDGNGECDPTRWSNVTDEAKTDFQAVAKFRESFYPIYPINKCPPGHPTCGWRTQCCGYDPNLANALIVIGETHGYSRPGNTPPCEMKATRPGQFWSSAAAVNTVAGFNQSWLANVTLPNGTYGYTVFRPWEYLEIMVGAPWTADDIYACNPIVVNPPYQPTN